MSYETIEEAKAAWPECDHIMVKSIEILDQSFKKCGVAYEYEGAIKGWYGKHIRKDGNAFSMAEWSEIPTV